MKYTCPFIDFCTAGSSRGGTDQTEEAPLTPSREPDSEEVFGESPLC